MDGDMNREVLNRNALARGYADLIISLISTQAPEDSNAIVMEDLLSRIAPLLKDIVPLYAEDIVLAAIKRREVRMLEIMEPIGVISQALADDGGRYISALLDKRGTSIEFCEKVASYGFSWQTWAGFAPISLIALHRRHDLIDLAVKHGGEVDVMPANSVPPIRHAIDGYLGGPYHNDPLTTEANRELAVRLLANGADLDFGGDASVNALIRARPEAAEKLSDLLREGEAMRLAKAAGKTETTSMKTRI